MDRKISTLPVIARPNPLSEQVYHAEVPAGLSIAQIIGGEPSGLRVWIDDVEVPRDYWSKVRPKIGHTIVIKALPGSGSGGKQTLRIVLFIAVTAAAVAAGNVFGAGLSSALGGAISTTTAQAVISTSLTIAGGLLINALIPVPLPENRQDSEPERIGALTGVSNRVVPYGVIPKIYGKMRYYPPLPMTSTPYTQPEDFTRIKLYSLFVLGYGPLNIGGVAGINFGSEGGHTQTSGPDKDVSDVIKIGETPISQFGEQGEDWDYRISVSTHASAYSLYKGTVVEESPDHSLEAVWLAGELVTGNRTVTHSDNREGIRVTEPDTTKIGITISFPQGIWTSSTNGTVVFGGCSVWFDIHYRENLPSPGSWLVWRQDYFVKGPTRETVHFSLEKDVPTSQYGYQVRIRRTKTYFLGEVVIADAVWSSLRSYKDGRPFEVDNILILELMVRSSADVTGVLQKLSVEVESRLPVYDGASWAYQTTHNPAWAYADMLRGTATYRPVADSEMDLTAIKNWADDIDQDPWGFNIVYDSPAPLLTRLKEAAVAGRAAFGIIDGKFTVVQDDVQTVPVQVVTPRNSWNFSGRRIFPDIPHALRVPYYDIDRLELLERAVYDDGYSSSNATKIELLQFPGITNQDQAWILGRYYLANMILRPEEYTFNMDAENIVCTRGSLIEIAEDTILVGLHYGRIVDVTGSPVTQFDSDEEILYQTGNTYGVHVRRNDGTVFTSQVTNPGSPSNTVVLSTSDADITVGDLFLFGIFGEEVIEAKVTNITYATDLVATITAVPAAPEVLDSDTAQIPDWDPLITEPVNYNNIAPRAPTILNIRSDESALLQNADGSLTVRMIVSYIGLVGQSGTQVHGFFREVASGHVLRVTVPGNTGQLILEYVSEGSLYEVWLQAEGITGLFSAKSTVVQHTVVGKTSPPPDVDVFTVVRLPDGTREASWKMFDEPLDLDGYVIRYSFTTTVWEDMLSLHEGILTSSPYEFSKPVVAGDFNFAIKAVDTSGNESVNAKLLGVTLGVGPLRGILDLFDFHAAGWPGTKTDCWVDPFTGNLIPDSARSFGTLGSWDSLGSWIGPVVSEYSYEHTLVNLGAPVSFTPLVTSLVADGDAVVEERHSEGGSSYTNWAPVGSVIRAQYIRMRLRVTTT